MTTISVMYPVMPTDIGDVLPYARVAETTSARRLWLGQSFGIETHAVFAALTGMGLDLGYGTAVTLMPLRHPLTAAVNARSIAALSGHPYVAGIGPGAAAFQKRANGHAYEKPVTAARHYLRMLRTLADGKEATDDDGPWPTEGLQLPPLDAPPVEIGLGVLREPMARLAGEGADRAITWLTPLDYLRERLAPAMQESARKTGRNTPRIVSVVHCAVARPRRDLQQVALKAVGAHLRSPHYSNMLNQAGIPVDPADPSTAAQMIVKHNLYATGTPDEIADTIASYHRAGVDEVALNVCGVHLHEGRGAALRDLTAITTALGRRSAQ
ncbi:5,10-methylene tetrahydromethanopterin reductase [Streptomyces sp. Ru73]|uniref:LLM class flavin-dependent oxidoreductase n=1 Tax=Streptomyces sp. Ru73 TaxID=2080748 RepID=UPI000CDD30DE|nr:LLM class flavin-dependent oxidoreductase [Streptomyces sp. Ru73]POX38801.1 5,10-methylene tetrahydromethanopterin reductase [Streptomyces sp. Ru73]